MDRTASGVARCIRLAREGQDEALNGLLDVYRNYLKLLASACLDPALKGKADASDVVQETLLKAYRSFPQFRGTTEMEWLGWIRRILATSLTDVHRRFSTDARRTTRERALEDRLDRSSLILGGLVPAPGPSPSEGAQHHERGALLADALAEIEPDEREVLVLRGLQELSWSEVGLRMGRTPDSARMLWPQALLRLGDLLKERMA